MKKVYMVYSEERNIGESIDIFTNEESAARFARDKSGFGIIEKTLIQEDDWDFEESISKIIDELDEYQNVNPQEALQIASDNLKKLIR